MKEKTVRGKESKKVDEEGGQQKDQVADGLGGCEEEEKKQESQDGPDLRQSGWVHDVSDGCVLERQSR